MASKKHSPLERYRAKRSAQRTPEPFGPRSAAAGSLFVVQHHAARRVHFDLRLEMDGVLRSWAVPKGPSPNPADKRLAVMVEDHPLDYASFEGLIPEGNYGAGAVIVWDRGRWRPLNDPGEGLESGKLLFELKGFKLRGKWTLVRTKGDGGDWLLIKERDGFVSEGGTEAYPMDSILSGLSVRELQEGVEPGRALERKLAKLGARRARVDARRVKLMLAQPGKIFSKPGWVFEIKYDGYRLLAAREDATARLLSRAGNDLTGTFPEIAKAMGALPFEHIVIDGEAVVHDETGLPSFAGLQKRGKLTRRLDIERAAVELPATFYAFDLLGLGEHDLRALPLECRKRLLAEALPTVGPIRYSDHIEERGEAMFEHTRELGLEGVVAKRADSRYEAGRSGAWVKINAHREDDFVIVGYTDPRGSRPQFGALLLGAHEEGKLCYAGRVGSGFGAAQQRDIMVQLAALPAAPPVEGAPAEKDQHWVAPRLVCAVRYKLVTPDGVLRQPVFLRLRDDKPPRECIRRPRALPEPAALDAAEETPREVPFSNLDKVYWPEEGYTKGDLLEYYRGIAPWLLPYLADRPVVMDRYPDGIHGKSFFQKDAPSFVPDWIRTERMWSEHTQREIGYFIVEDVASLLYIINLGSIPLHVWSSRTGSLERPDWCILDLDPKGAPFPHVVRIAKAIQALCDDIELPSFVKTSGSSGLHVLVPLGAQCTYEQSRTLGELIGRIVAAEMPDIATLVRTPSKRGGRVYIDYVQNGHGRLLVSAFSARPRAAAPVSMPLRQRELTTKLRIEQFNIANAVGRMKRMKADPMREVLTAKPDLVAALERLAQLYR